MSDTASKAPVWFLIVGLLALVWNLMGVANYIMQAFMTPEAMAALPAAERANLESVPAWATSAFAIAVHGGALGSLFLILKKKWATPVLALSLLGVLLSMFNSYVLSDAMSVYGGFHHFMMVITVAIAVYLLLLSRSAQSKGWIG